MASIINASSSGSGGIVQTADASGVLQLQSNGTVAVNIASGGAVGIGGITNPTFPLVVQTSGTSTAVAGNVIARLQSTNTGYDATLQFSDNITNSGFMSMNSGNMIIGSYGTESIRFKSGGTVILQNGSTSATGTGITFPGTQNPSSDANTLDDYEEGTFSPGLMFGSGGTTGIVYGAQNGIYIKIGRMVWVRCGWILSSKGSSTGTAYVTNLPFTSQSQSYSDPSVLFTGAAWTSLSGTLQGVIENNQTYIRLVTNTSTGYVSLTNSNVNGTSELYAQFCYCTAN